MELGLASCDMSVLPVALVQPMIEKSTFLDFDDGYLKRSSRRCKTEGASNTDSSSHLPTLLASEPKPGIATVVDKKDVLIGTRADGQDEKYLKRTYLERWAKDLSRGKYLKKWATDLHRTNLKMAHLNKWRTHFSASQAFPVKWIVPFSEKWHEDVACALQDAPRVVDSKGRAVPVVPQVFNSKGRDLKLKVVDCNCRDLDLGKDDLKVKLQHPDNYGLHVILDHPKLQLDKTEECVFPLVIHSRIRLDVHHTDQSVGILQVYSRGERKWLDVSVSEWTLHTIVLRCWCKGKEIKKCVHLSSRNIVYIAVQTLRPTEIINLLRGPSGQEKFLVETSCTKEHIDWLRTRLTEVIRLLTDSVSWTRPSPIYLIKEAVNAAVEFIPTLQPELTDGRNFVKSDAFILLCNMGSTLGNILFLLSQMLMETRASLRARAFDTHSLEPGAVSLLRYAGKLWQPLAKELKLLLSNIDTQDFKKVVEPALADMGKFASGVVPVLSSIVEDQHFDGNEDESTREEIFDTCCDVLSSFGEAAKPAASSLIALLRDCQTCEALGYFSMAIAEVLCDIGKTIEKPCLESEKADWEEAVCLLENLLIADTTKARCDDIEFACEVYQTFCNLLPECDKRILKVRRKIFKCLELMTGNTTEEVELEMAYKTLAATNVIELLNAAEDLQNCQAATSTDVPIFDPYSDDAMIIGSGYLTDDGF